MAKAVMFKNGNPPPPALPCSHAVRNGFPHGRGQLAKVTPRPPPRGTLSWGGGGG